MNEKAMEKELHRSIAGPGKSWQRTTGALLTMLFGFALLLIGTGLTQLSYDLMFLLQPAKLRPEVVIVYMDETSHRELDQASGSVWDRSLHARLLDRLRDSGADVVVFDMLFANAGRDPSVDRSLADAIRSHGKVILAGIEGLRAGPGFVGIEVHAPHQSFQKEAAGIGLATMIVDPDGVIRKARLKSAAGLPSLALAALSVLDNAASRSPPPFCWLNYYGPSGSIPHVSYVDALLANRLPRGFFNGKVVFVGMPSNAGFSGGEADAFPTPYARWIPRSSPGVEIHATAFLNLLRGEWLIRWNSFAEFGLVILFGAGFGYGLARLRARQSFLISLVGCLGVVIATCVLFRLAHVWSPWLVFVAQIIFAAGWAFFIRFLTRIRRRQTPEEAFATGSVIWN